MSVLCECVCECQCVWVCVCMFVCMCLNEVTNSTKSDVLNNKEFYFNNGQEVELRFHYFHVGVGVWCIRD